MEVMQGEGRPIDYRSRRREALSQEKQLSEGEREKEGKWRTTYRPRKEAEQIDACEAVETVIMAESGATAAAAAAAGGCLRPCVTSV